jgi:hypothetical protein
MMAQRTPPGPVRSLKNEGWETCAETKCGPSHGLFSGRFSTRRQDRPRSGNPCRCNPIAPHLLLLLLRHFRYVQPWPALAHRAENLCLAPMVGFIHYVDRILESGDGQGALRVAGGWRRVLWRDSRFSRRARASGHVGSVPGRTGEHARRLVAVPYLSATPDPGAGWPGSFGQGIAGFRLMPRFGPIKRRELVACLL